MNNKLDKTINLIKNDLSKMVSKETLDSYSGNDVKDKVKTCIESEFKDLINLYRRNNKNFDSLLRHSVLGGPQFRKRKDIIKNYALLAKEHFNDKYPNLSIELEFAKFASEPIFSPYEQIDAEEFIVEAAAIYALEVIFDYSKEKQAFKYMPKDADSLSLSITHPEATDCLFADELIESLCYLFQNQTKNDINEISYLLTEELANSGKYEVKEYSNPINNKEKILSILSLIPLNEVNRTINAFKNDVWRLIDIVLSIESKYQDIINKEYEKTNTLIHKLEKESQNLNNVLITKEPDPLKAAIITKEIEDSIEYIEDTINAKHLLRMGTCFMHQDNTILDEEIEQEYSKLLYDFEITSPYETCFAFMYLLMTNDELIWLINPCATLLEVAASKLPWTKDYNIQKESNEKEQEAEEETFKKIDELLDNGIDTSAYGEKINKFNDNLYALKYNDAYNWHDYHNAGDKDLLKINFPQYCFNYNEIIPPRYSSFSIRSKEPYLASGFSEEEINTLRIVNYLLDGVNDKYTFEYEDIKNDIEISQNRIDELSQNNEHKNKKIHILEEKVKNLQKSLSDIKKEYKQYKETYNNDADEINRLRELVYTIQNQNQEEAPLKPQSIDIPYYSKKKVVVIGGSDTWINKMKETIQNVSFISSKQRINNDIIKQAEVIWIQIIGLSHSDYYSVLGYAKKHHIPIYYFSYSNIDKCLIQFVNSEENH